MLLICSLAAVVLVQSIGPIAFPLPPLGAEETLTLALPRRPTAEEMVALELTVGHLAPDSRIVIRTKEGEIVGSIVPYGIKPDQKARTYSIPVPSKAIDQLKVTLKLEVLDKKTRTSRTPTKTEIENKKLTFIPTVGGEKLKK